MDLKLLNIFKDLGIILASFLAGAIPFCFILGRMISGKRLTEIGDKNPGGWNLVFNVSKIWGVLGILLDMAKGYFAYFLALKFSGPFSIQILGTDYNMFIAAIAGCASVAGHNYSPFMKFNGGKGLAAWGGFVLAANPYVFIPAAAGFLSGIFIARNMIWSVMLAVTFSGIFLSMFSNYWTFAFSPVFLLTIALLFAIMLPRQINKNNSLGINFKFRKEATVGDLFKPKIR